MIAGYKLDMDYCCIGLERSDTDSDTDAGTRKGAGPTDNDSSDSIRLSKVPNGMIVRTLDYFRLSRDLAGTCCTAADSSSNSDCSCSLSGSNSDQNSMTGSDCTDWAPEVAPTDIVR